MQELIDAIDGLPAIVKYLLCIPVVSVVWMIYRICRSVAHNNTLGLVLGIYILARKERHRRQVDMVLEASGAAAFERLDAVIPTCGYIRMRSEEGRVSFNRGYTPKGFAQEVFHLHLRLPGDADEVFFRDYLNLRPDLTAEYEQLKLSLWKPYERDRDGYTAAKGDFVRRVTAEAKRHFTSQND